jgi:hypothetical protein
MRSETVKEILTGLSYIIRISSKNTDIAQSGEIADSWLPKQYYLMIAVMLSNTSLIFIQFLIFFAKHQLQHFFTTIHLRLILIPT